ncbi:hypothetical protein SASPL_103055 [Salvia splendens]|uniref:Translation initiation factor IF- 2 domain-containing protein n=1 Tax=Salvia splendens TaxID=180675 RepID=A0A8X9AEE7_SALSN|nr:hypothetical protein SASPL_103055 [Salvia splendens]
MGRKSATAIESNKKGFAMEDDVAFNDVDGEAGDKLMPLQRWERMMLLQLNLVEKKKAKGIKSGYNSGFVASAFGLLGEDDDDDVERGEKDDKISAFELVDERKSAEIKMEMMLVLVLLLRKTKNKKKKGGKNLQEEEEDLDKILAELGVPLPPAQLEKAEEEGHVEAITSKKKGKEKEGKASAAEEKPEDTNSKVSGKKVSKHKKRLREKKKLLKKRQEGKLLTGKQKEEARRLEAMRNQILANAKLELPTGEPARRPLYQKKKSKPQNQSNRESTDEKETREDVVLELASVEAENVEVTDVVDDNGVDDDEEWDSKSWDEADLTLPGKSVFADEEVDSESEPLPKKDMPIGLVEKVMPPKLENVDVQNNCGREEENRSCTHVQEGEAGGITQQIGATYFPDENIRERTKLLLSLRSRGLNTELYYKNKEMGETYNIVPTSAKSGEGIPDLLLLLVQWAQKTMIKRLTYSEEVQCTILEVKVDEGHETTIDIVLVNGVLREGDQIVVGGMLGPIVTSIRALLTPHPMTEFRVKGTYFNHKEIKAAQCIKIAAQHAIAGASLYVVGPNDYIEDIKESAMAYVNKVMSRIGKSGKGVCLQASTLGSLEALLDFLETPAVNIPVSTISIGPVYKRDVKKASVMLEKKKEYGTILPFDVKVAPDAQEHADELGVKIFTADIIYHLFVQFKVHIDNFKLKRREKLRRIRFSPVSSRSYQTIGTAICVPNKRGFLEIGQVTSIKNNDNPVDSAKKGQKVSIKIIGSNPEEQKKMLGRHFEVEDLLKSKISRHSIDALIAYFKDELSTEDVTLLNGLKKEFGIP